MGWSTKRAERSAATIPAHYSPVPGWAPPALRARSPVLAAAALLLVFLCWALFFAPPILPRGFIAYSTRPLWDKSEAPNQVFYHYGADEVDDDALCELHGWKKRAQETELWDATIFSTELDLLLIRLAELSPHVSRFFLLESTRTFTGLEKPLLLPTALNSPAFAPYKDRITYQTFTGSELKKGEEPWVQEIALRQQMTTLLRSSLSSHPSSSPAPVMLFSDVDELPSRATARLLKACEFPAPMHLGMRSYLYSYEWQEGGETSSWRASAVVWPNRGAGPDEFYRHGKVTERVLADSGWHCSWCFRYLRDFVTKATGYSHVDRLGSRPSALLRPERIQETICKGLDMFGMLPEAYDYRDLFNKMRLIPAKSAVSLPAYVAAHAKELRYLLPGEGNCRREDAPK